MRAGNDESFPCGFVKCWRMPKRSRVVAVPDAVSALTLQIVLRVAPAPLPPTAGLSQAAFADVLGLHRTYVGGLERCERNLKLKSVERLADMLELEPLQLLKEPRRRVRGR